MKSVETILKGDDNKIETELQDRNDLESLINNAGKVDISVLNTTEVHMMD